MEISRAAGKLPCMPEESAPRLTVIVLGSGTSQGVPMIGCKCHVCQSPDPRDKRTRSSIFVAAPRGNILVDTTPELRQQSLREGLDRLDAVLFTHPHADHIMGFDDLRRFCEIKGGPLPIYGSASTLAGIEHIFHYAFNPRTLIPGYVHVLPHVITEKFELGGIDFTPLPVPHGAVSTLGFLLSHEDRKMLAYLSDCASVPDPVREIVRGCEVLIIDGLRDKTHPTHLTVGGAIEVAQAMKAGRTYLTHQTHEKRHADRMRDLPPGVEVAYDWDENRVRSQARMKRKRHVAKTDVAPEPNAPRLVFLQALTIVTAVGWIYWPALHGGWLWDDALLISENALVHDPNGWWKIWLQPQGMFDFQPVEVSVVWVEWHLWGAHTSGYHAVSALLHAVSALLVWWLLGKLGLRFAWLGGLLFAVHPVMVESVAWMAELKNTLSLPPFLLAMCAYLDYDARGKRSDYLWALGLFLVAMLCKTSMAMFPFVVLLYIWCKRGRISVADLKTTAPFLAISIAVGLLAIWFLHRAATSIGLEVGDRPPGDFFARLFFAGSILAFYFSKSLFPVGLLPIYPMWKADFSSISTWLEWIGILGVIGVCWVKRSQWGRPVLLGLGFFAINLVPFLGLNAAPYMGFTWVADHILYLPIIGLIGLAVAGVGKLVELGRSGTACSELRRCLSACWRSPATAMRVSIAIRKRSGLIRSPKILTRGRATMFSARC